MICISFILTLMASFANMLQTVFKTYEKSCSCFAQKKFSNAFVVDTTNWIGPCFKQVKA